MSADHRCSLVGPISGHLDGNRAAFAAMDEILAGEGWTVFNPRRHDLSDLCAAEAEERGEHYRSGPMYRQLMRVCIDAIIRHADAVFVLEGWQDSFGARLEVLVARSTGVPVFDAHTRLALPDHRLPRLLPAMIDVQFTPLGPMGVS